MAQIDVYPLGSPSSVASCSHDSSSRSSSSSLPAMPDLSENDCLAIHRYPLEPTIGNLRNSLQQALGSNSTDFQKTEMFSTKSKSIEAEEEPDIKDAILSLLTALQAHRVARILLLTELGTVASQLAMLYFQLDSGQIDTTPFLGLIDAVVRKISDIEIWKLVLRLIVTVSRTTPPTSELLFGGTPRKVTSSSHRSSEQSVALVEQGLRDELWDCSYIKVSGFFEKYFDGKRWTQKSKGIFESVRDTFMDDRWMAFLTHPTEDALWEWWSAFQGNHLVGLPGYYYTTRTKEDMRGLDVQGQLNVLVKASNKPSLITNWKDVHVVGELTASIEDRKFIQLARSARNIFVAQPRRRFLHGFIICSTSMTLHVFDRSGTYCSESFDINNEPERFIRIISGYCFMNDEELGLDTFIDRVGTKDFVTVDTNTINTMQLQIEIEPIAVQNVIAGRATSCFPTIDNKHVAKFSWVPATKWLVECELLRIADEKNVKGVVKLIGYRRIVSIEELRSGLILSKKRQLQGRMQKSIASFSSSNKRRKSIDPEEATSVKKTRSNNQESRLSQDDKVSRTLQSTDNSFADRVFSCLVVSPAGRSIHAFTSVIELLRALRDAMKAHRSLFLEGNILHRDISDNNIIITDPNETDGFSGMLIDLDLATTVENGKNTRSGAQKMTGTLRFMAIEVIEMALRYGKPDLEHTYRHDLESFFYVFLYICANPGFGKEERLRADPFRSWYCGSYEDIVLSKSGCMGRHLFKSIVLEKFLPMFKQHIKQLAIELRDILFLRGESLRIGTPEEPSVLYDKMTNAFDRAIEKC